MSESIEQPGDVSQYGRWRAQQHRAHLEQSAANGAAAELEAHRDVSAQLGAVHRGLYPGMTPTDMGAEVSGRSARVGDDFGGRDLEAQGGTFSWSDISDSPAPALVDRRYIDQPGQRPTGESPLAAYMRGRQ